MVERAVREPGPATSGAQPCSPLLRRAVATGVSGAAIAACTFLGAGSASAVNPVVIDSCTGSTASSEYGQPIEASPAALQSQLEQATLLVYPLRFDLAKQAKAEFLSADPVQLGTVSNSTQSFSGGTLAKALTPRVTSLSSIAERATDVANQLRNLAPLSCPGGSKVSGQEASAPSPQPSSPQPATTKSAPAAQPGSTRSAGPSHDDAPWRGADAPPTTLQAVPPGWTYAAGSLPPWVQYGQVPQSAPDMAPLANQDDQRRQVRDAEVRAAGNAVPMASDASKRVALPVMVAAIMLAVVTGGLVRTWVLRRH